MEFEDGLDDLLAEIDEPSSSKKVKVAETTNVEPGKYLTVF